jgi:hypothetical protein
MTGFRSAFRHERELRSKSRNRKTPIFRLLQQASPIFQRQLSPSPQPRAHSFAEANVDCATHDFDGPERAWLFTAELPTCSDRRRNPCARPIPPVEGRLSRRSAARPRRHPRWWTMGWRRRRKPTDPRQSSRTARRGDRSAFSADGRPSRPRRRRGWRSAQVVCRRRYAPSEKSIRTGNHHHSFTSLSKA